MEIQQSPLFAKYILSLGWIVEQIDKDYIYIKKLPFIGSICKIQRTKKLPPVRSFLTLCKRYYIHTIALEPDSSLSETAVTNWLAKLPSSIHVNTDYYLPTKTIRVNLRPSINKIFQSFTEAKRRAVRRAQNLGVEISESDDIKTFIKIKNKAAGFLGSITTFGVNTLWPIWHPKNTSILFAHNSSGQIVGGILLLYWDDVAYYWIAGATHEGKKLFAPTLLVWHAIKLAKSQRCKHLDFVGIWDDRLPDKNKQWLGFTKFKEGFGGSTLLYPLAKNIT